MQSSDAAIAAWLSQAKRKPLKSLRSPLRLPQSLAGPNAISPCTCSQHYLVLSQSRAPPFRTTPKRNPTPTRSCMRGERKKAESTMKIEGAESKTRTQDGREGYGIETGPLSGIISNLFGSTAQVWLRSAASARDAGIDLALLCGMPAS
eukprot:1682981-Rhodomonas_salina.2